MFPFRGNLADTSDKDKGVCRLLKTLPHNPVGHRKFVLSTKAERLSYSHRRLATPTIS